MMDGCIYAYGYGSIPPIWSKNGSVYVEHCASQKEDIVSSDNGTFTKTVHVLDDKDTINVKK